jgi:DNA-binding transcriptional LysR family regulator
MTHPISHHIELRHLRCFIAVAEELSFHRAAARLQVSQQQVSRTIQDLEVIIGTPLMRRTTRRVDVSPPGEIFLPRARQILEHLESALKQTQMAATGRLGRLTVSFAGCAIESFLPEVFQRLRTEHPGIDLQIREQNSAAQFEALQRNEIDAGFGISPSPDTGIQKMVLSRSPFVLIAPTALDLDEAPASLDRFKDLPFILVPRHIAPGFHQDCATLFSEAGFAPRIVHEGRNTQIELSLVAAGIGVAIGPSFMARHQRNGIRYIPIKSSHRAELALLSRRDNQSAALQALKRVASNIYLESEFASMPPPAYGFGGSTIHSTGEQLRGH